MCILKPEELGLREWGSIKIYPGQLIDNVRQLYKAERIDKITIGQ